MKPGAVMFWAMRVVFVAGGGGGWLPGAGAPREGERLNRSERRSGGRATENETVIVFIFLA